MRFATVCSGIGAPETAWVPLGWTPVFTSEIEPFPSAVLAHHYPDVPNLGDMTLIDGLKYRGLVDVLCGGCPCQSFSIAGLRRSLADDRGNITLQFVRLCDEIDPAFVLFENVPGILNTPDNAFGCFLGALAGEDVALEPPGGRWSDAGYVLGPKRAIAWRCLDAQYFGLAQRRKRVFVVGCPRDGSDPRAVLFECDGMQRDTPPRRQTGEGATHDLAPSLTSSGRGVARSGETRGQDPFVAVNDRSCAFGGNNTSGPIDVATALNAHGGPAGRMDFESETFILRGISDYGPGAPVLRAKSGDAGGGAEVLITHSLRAEGFDASEDGTGRATPLVPVAWNITPSNSNKDFNARESDRAQAVTTGGNRPSARGGDLITAFSCKDYGADAGGVSATLRSMGHDGSHANAGGQVAVAFQTRIARNGRGQPSEIVPSLNGADAGATSDMRPCVATASAVRRLMPVECLRLQGFPDKHLSVLYRGKPAADGPMYKATGNSMAVPCIRWLGVRIQSVHDGAVLPMPEDVCLPPAQMALL